MYKYRYNIQNVKREDLFLIQRSLVVFRHRSKKRLIILVELAKAFTAKASAEAEEFTWQVLRL